MPLRLIALKPPLRLYRLLPLMPAVFLVYLIVMIILLFVLRSIELFKVLFFTLLLVLIAFNLVLILQYGLTLSKLAGDTTFRRILPVSLVAVYIVMLAQVIAIFFTERSVETVFTVIRLTALIGAILVAIAIIASRSSALIAIVILASLTAITLLATAVLTSLEGTGPVRKLTDTMDLDVTGLVLLGLITTLQFITLHSLLNQPFAFTFLLILFITDLISRPYDALGSVAFILLVFAYTPGILSLATLSWLVYKAYKATGNIGFKRVALILVLEVVASFILLPQATIPVTLMELAVRAARQSGSEGTGEFFWLLFMTTLLLTVVQAAKWYIAIRPLEDSQAATSSSSTHSQRGEGTQEPALL